MSPEAQLEALRSAIPGIQDSLYLSIAGVTILFLDHFYSLAMEIEYIWPMPFNFTKFAFLFNRYMFPPFLLLYLSLLSGSTLGLNPLFCRNSMAAVAIFAVISMSGNNVLLLAKIRRLWENERFASVTIYVVGVAFALAAFTVMGFVASEVLEGGIIGYDKILGICIMTDGPAFLKGFWIITIAFDFFLFLMLFLNALNKPRTEHAALVRILHRDGVWLFLTITALRIFNLVMCIQAQPARILEGQMLTWALVITMASRMLLSLQKAEVEAGANESFIALNIIKETF